MSSVVGIDLGTDYIKIGIAKPGSSFQIVEDESGKRKFPAVIGFDTTQRLFGNAAMGMSLRKPNSVIFNVKKLIGKPFTDELRDYFHSHGLLYSIEPNERFSSSITIPDQGTFAAEELLAMLLEYCVHLGKIQAQTKISGVVIAIPPYFTQSQRQAIIDAANIAEINLLSLVNDNTAAGLQYGIDKVFVGNETAEIVLMYNMGAETTSATVLKYAPMTVYSRFSNKTIGSVEVIGYGYNEAFGGNHFDRVLVNMFVEEFGRKHGQIDSLRTNEKAMMKLRQMAKRVKEILSINEEYAVYIESLLNDIDFSMVVKKEVFVKNCEHLVSSVPRPILSALEMANIPLVEVSSFVLIGGGVRVPYVKEILKNEFGLTTFNLNLNGDESIALGSTIVAANISSSFRVRQFGMADMIPNPIGIRIASITGEEVDKTTVLFEYPVSVPSRPKKVSLAVTGDIKVFLYFISNGTSDGTSCDFREDYHQFLIAGIQEKVDELTTKAKVVLGVGKTTIGFQVGPDGIAIVTDAKVAIDVMKAAKNSTQNESLSNSSEGSLENATSSETLRFKLRVSRLQTSADGCLQIMDDADIRGSREKLRVWTERDQSAIRIGEVLNSLEAFIYSTRDRVSDDENLRLVSTGSDLESLSALLTEVEDWLYDNEEEESVEKYSKELDKLTSLTDPMFLRVRELTARPAAIENGKALIAQIKNKLSGTLDWLPETDKETMAQKISAYQEWLAGKLVLQEKLAPHDELIVLSNDIEKELDKLRLFYTVLQRRVKPPPPKVDLNATQNSTTANSSTANSTTKDVEHDEL